MAFMSLSSQCIIQPTAGDFTFANLIASKPGALGDEKDYDEIKNITGGLNHFEAEGNDAVHERN